MEHLIVGIIKDDAMVTRQLTSTLVEVGGSVDRNDPQVRRLGTCHAITQGVLENDITTKTRFSGAGYTPMKPMQP